MIERLRVIERLREKAFRTTVATAISLSASGVLSAGSVEASDMFDVCAGDVITVYDGDSLWGVAQETNTTIDVIVDNNDHIDDQDSVIKPGDRVCVPTVEQARNMSRSSHVSTETASTESGSCEDIQLTSWATSRIPGTNGDRVLDNGDEAKALQLALNNAGVNVGHADGVIGSRTLRGLATFQNREFNGKVDCIVGSGTYVALGLGAIALQSDKSTIANSIKDTYEEVDIDKVVIDLSDKQLVAYEDGKIVMTTRISAGDGRTYYYEDPATGSLRTGQAITRTGTSTVYRTEGSDYASRELGGAPGSMGHARFFDGGLAVHVGNIWRASHGCIRVLKGEMIRLVTFGFGLKDKVIVQE